MPSVNEMLPRRELSWSVNVPRTSKRNCRRIRPAAVRQKTETLAEHAGSSRKFEGKLILQADETIPFHVLQKVMYTSQTVGFYDITLAVIQK